MHELQEQSLALELLKDYKKQNKRQFVIILVILGMFTCLLGYTIWLLNDIYIPAKYDEQGNLIEPEHKPYYSTTIFAPDKITEEEMNELYVEEEIKESEV